MKRLGSSILFAILMLLSLPALAQNGAGTAPPAAGPGYGPGYGPMWGYGHHHFWGGGWGFHPFGVIFFVILCVFLIAVVMRMFGFGRHCGYGRFRHRGYGGRGGGALDILEERFAKGEIDKNEFEEKRKLLMR
jgi:putative membrane protein